MGGVKTVPVSPGRRAQRAVRAGIHPCEVFQALLRHERARADRNGGGFSLAVFPMGLDAALGRRIHAAMRSIDELGWIDDESVGVILPATTLSGAHAFARRVVESAPHGGEKPIYTVYEYPHHWLPGRASQGTGSSPDDARTAGSLFEFRAGLPEVLERVFSEPLPHWKRILDVSGAAIILVTLAPLLALIGLYIKLVSPGPVLFRQQRIGLRGHAFTFLKFRTMRSDNNQNVHKHHIVEAIRSDGKLEKLDDRGDERIIPGGRILRKTCLDELPQLVNVLRAEMSLVGPRPCMPYEADEFLRWHTHRFDVLPGMTGLWQISGKNKLTFSQMIRLDITYARNMSIGNDVRILLLTLPAIVRMVLEAVAEKLRQRRAEVADVPVLPRDCDRQTS